MNTGAAIEEPAAQAFLRSCVPWIVGIVVVGAGFIGISVVALVVWDWPKAWYPMSFGGGIVAVGYWAWNWYLGIRHMVSTNPWVERGCRFGYNEWHGTTWQAVLHLDQDAADPASAVYSRHVSSIRRTFRRYRPVEGCDGGAVRIVGDPTSPLGVLVSPPDAAVAVHMGPYARSKKPEGIRLGGRLLWRYRSSVGNYPPTGYRRTLEK